MIVLHRTASSYARLAAVALLCLPLVLAACGSNKPAAPAEQTPAASGAKPLAEPETPLPPPPAFETELPEDVQNAFAKPSAGDFDELVKRRLVRLGVTFNRTFYFVDKGVQRGVLYDYGTFMEERLNTHFNTGNLKIHVVFVPLPRDMLLPALIKGNIDLVAAQVTVRPELQKLVDFSNPTRTNVNEILVTAPGAPAVASVEDLSSKIAAFWKKVFPNLTVHENVAVRTGGVLAVAMRKNSPQLAAALNKFMANYGLGSAFGNQIERRYLVSTKCAKNATSEAERQKFLALVELFRKYGDQYNLDFLLMAAQAYQESQLNQEAKSQVGAIGIMQIMPATGADLKVGDIQQLEPNIHGGVK